MGFTLLVKPTLNTQRTQIKDSKADRELLRCLHWSSKTLLSRGQDLDFDTEWCRERRDEQKIIYKLQ